MGSAPILRDVPDELRTARFVMRPPREGDGVAVHAAVVESLDDLRAWPASLPWAMFEPSVDASEVFCRESRAAFLRRTSFVYLVFDQDGQFVANTSLHDIDWAIPKFEVGYWCRRTRQRQGVMREALSALVDLAQHTLGARRVDCRTDAANVASRALCESAGFTLEGVLRQDRITPTGELRDSCIYAIAR